MNVARIIEIAKQNDFAMHEYEEKGVLCGYELETWTQGGVNMIHFIDCRCEEGVTPKRVLSELKEILENFDVDDEIDRYRQGERYRRDFTIRESLEDFEKYLDRLTQFVEAVEKSTEEMDPADVIADIFNVIEGPLARAGYKILDGDRDTVFIRRRTDDVTESDYQIKVEEIIP